ncbi:MAG: hypothetical protein UHL07_05730, partial [Bacteroidaceae bacterium]|nr:hypothetical protein [Bacteroidaceae bacterium]
REACITGIGQESAFRYTCPGIVDGIRMKNDFRADKFSKQRLCVQKQRPCVYKQGLGLYKHKLCLENLPR